MIFNHTSSAASATPIEFHSIRARSRCLQPWSSHNKRPINIMTKNMSDTSSAFFVRTIFTIWGRVATVSTIPRSEPRAWEQEQQLALGWPPSYDVCEQGVGAKPCQRGQGIQGNPLSKGTGNIVQNAPSMFWVGWLTTSQKHDSSRSSSR